MISKTLNPHEFSFITASSETKYLHLYHQAVSLDPNDFQFSESESKVVHARVLNRTQLTNGDWCVEWRENIRFDEENDLIYFIGYRNPLESHL